MNDKAEEILLSEIAKRDDVLRAILDECGPRKMSETMGTVFSRIKHIEKLVREVLGDEKSK